MICLFAAAISENASKPLWISQRSQQFTRSETLNSEIFFTFLRLISLSYLWLARAKRRKERIWFVLSGNLYGKLFMASLWLISRIHRAIQLVSRQPHKLPCKSPYKLLYKLPYKLDGVTAGLSSDAHSFVANTPRHTKTLPLWTTQFDTQCLSAIDWRALFIQIGTLHRSSGKD